MSTEDTPPPDAKSRRRSAKKKTDYSAGPTKRSRQEKESGVGSLDIAYQSKDIALKVVGDAFRGAFLSHFYPDLPPIVEPLPSELPRIQITTDETDLLFRLQDGSILHLEFQSTQRSEDLLRFVGYHIAAYAQYIQPVTTIVFYGAGITRAPAALDTSQVVFKPHIVLLGNENGEKALSDLQEKVDRGEELTAEDQVLLILLPLMAQKQPLEEILLRAARVSTEAARGQARDHRGGAAGLGVQ